jgi:hypothetical protein
VNETPAGGHFPSRPGVGKRNKRSGIMRYKFLCAESTISIFRKRSSKTKPRLSDGASYRNAKRC